MITINIERLIDTVVNEHEAYSGYREAGRNLCKGPYEECAKRRERLEYCHNYYDREQSAVWAVTEVLDFDKEQLKRLYIAARAVRRWRVRTNYERLIPDSMAEQIEKFILWKWKEKI